MKYPTVRDIAPKGITLNPDYTDEASRERAARRRFRGADTCGRLGDENFDELIEAADDHVDDAIAAAAVVLATQAYAEMVEQLESDGDDHDWDRPSPGGVWHLPVDVPDSVVMAANTAMRRAADTACGNPDPAFLLAAAAEADGVNADELDESFAEEFGNAFGFMAAGAGVSWFDDHAEFEVDIPDVEVHADDDGGEVDWFVSEAAMRWNPEMSAATRDHLNDRDFALQSQRKLPLSISPGRLDPAHVKAAMSRFGQVTDVPSKDRRLAYDRILRAARVLGIDAAGFKSRYARHV